MSNDEYILKRDVRELTGYTSDDELSDSGLNAAVRRAKSHIKVARGLPRQFDWYDGDFPEREHALFWFTCLFTKIQVGDLDSQTVSVGSIEADELLAKDEGAETQWYRNAQKALRAIGGEETGYGASNVVRADRNYSPGTRSQGASNSDTAVDDVNL